MKNLVPTISILLSIPFVLCSCNKVSTNMIENINDNHYDMVSNLYVNGAIIQSDDAENRSALYLDYNTMITTPLCNKPNCKHNDSNCLSYKCLNNNAMCFIYNDCIYWFESAVNIVDADNGTDTKADINTILYQGNISTGEYKKFVEIPDVCMDSATEMITHDDSLYVIGAESVYQEEDGSWTQMSNIGNQYLYKINLDNGEIKNYGLINDAPTAYYNWTAHGIIDANVMLTGIYNDKLYMSYRYVDNVEAINDYVDYQDDWVDAEEKIPWNRVNKCLDFKTDTICESDLPAADLIENGCYIYNDETFHILDESGTEYVCSEITADNDYHTTFVNDILWKGSENLCFSIKNNKEYVIAEKYQNKELTVLAYNEGKYIISYTDDLFHTCFDKVSEDELLKIKE